MVRVERDHDLPIHFEACSLKAPVRAVGWVLALLAITAGTWWFVRAEHVTAEFAAMVLVIAGGTLVVLLVRCRRYEVTVGKRLLELRLGPFRRTFPASCIDQAIPRLATGWRRFYARQELELSPSVATRRIIVPTTDPKELRKALLRNP